MPNRMLARFRRAMVVGLIVVPNIAIAAPPEVAGPFRAGDTVAWIGSSSTRIGVWPKTMEFLLRTRFPTLNLTFATHTSGGGTFATGLEHYDTWLDESDPDLVVFNYGGNDAGAGRDGLPKFLDTMGRSVAEVESRGARVVLITPQAADVRKSGLAKAANRTLYAETMLGIGRERGWNVLDIHHPLDALQRAGQADDPDYTILKDTIHLTDSAYIAWGIFLYDRLGLPFVRSSATLSADGRVEATEHCEVTDVDAGPDGLAFTRADAVLPILPPGPLPPRLHVPLEAHARYLLAVEGLEPGRHEIRCEGKPVGSADAEALAAGVNLNALLIDRAAEAPWNELGRAIWDGERLDEIGRTRWRFEVRKE